ncbi:Pimeloyl-ACP methyl ester carboxylesterase OS=Streptomyces griseomycini OX=66895 GN=FHS37_001137 PE=4 SV=1 [Streptomyces griseomycini]
MDLPLAAGVAAKGTVLLLPGFAGSENSRWCTGRSGRAGTAASPWTGGGGAVRTGPRTTKGLYARAELARDVLAQVAALGGPVHLVGHSLGGQIARAAVLLDHSPFRSLTLVSSRARPDLHLQGQRVKLLRTRSR